MGFTNIVTFREKSCKIIRDYYNSPRGDEEAHKCAILETAAKLIKSDIKTITTAQTETYPTTSDLEITTALDYTPASLRSFLQHMFVSKDTSRKVAGIGQAIIQVVRTRAVIAPLQLGLAVQIHHMYRSQFIIDTLSSLGMCSSYSEVQQFEMNAACTLALSNNRDTVLLFAGDNVDHNIATLDAKGTFHGMGIIAAKTPGKQVSVFIQRQRVSELNLVELAKITIQDYRYTEHTNRLVKFQPLKQLPFCERTVDIFWEMSFFQQITPSWQGMMHLLHNECDHPGKSSIQILPMIEMNPGDKTCIFSTLDYICKLAAKHNMPAIVTFDQPLFWKEHEVVNSVPDDSPIRNVVLLLRSFHTLMNLLGAIGTLMDGTGLNDILEIVYGENAVIHMKSGKAVQRTFRGHLLVDQGLTRQIVSLIMTDDHNFEDQIIELERLYLKGWRSNWHGDNVEVSMCTCTWCKSCWQKDLLAANSKTSKLWLNYQHMVGISRSLVAADRMGCWELHLSAIAACLPVFAAAGHSNYLKSSRLYLQKMLALENDHPEIYQKFKSGFHVIRRGNQYWTGLGSDLVIEQTLMRSLKSQGGLTHGSGMTEQQRAIWVMSSTVSSLYNLAMQEFTGNSYSSSEQHKEMLPSRTCRDEADYDKVASELNKFSPFPDDESLHNIITGVHAHESVNVHDMFTIGTDIVEKMDGQSIFSYSYHRAMKVKPLGSVKAIKIAEDHTIDPALFFQRFLLVSQTGELQLEDVMTYELCPFPMSLFEMKNVMRQPDKPQLAEAIRNQATNECDNIINQIVPLSDHYVLDGGSLLHRLKWVEGSSYSTIANEYAAFPIKHYGKATVVFDSYGNKADRKDCAHHHRYSKNVNAKKVNITLEAKFVGKKEDFLSNKENKQALIWLIMNIMQQRGCTVLQAEGDADVEIVKTAVTMSAFKSTSLIGEDTDLLVLSLYHVQPTKCIGLYYYSDKAKSHVYDIKNLKLLLGESICDELLFLHAFTGCDSTSRIFGIEKKNSFPKGHQKWKRNSRMCQCIPFTWTKSRSYKNEWLQSNGDFV